MQRNNLGFAPYNGDGNKENQEKRRILKATNRQMQKRSMNQKRVALKELDN